MGEVNAIISAWRAYEFPPDRIGLQTLTLSPVGTAIREAFKFRIGAIAVPPATFGPSPKEPGVIFQIGVLEGDGVPDIPVRELYFEPRRVVIAVAGPSSAIDRVWTKLRAALTPFQAPDGAPILPEGATIRDSSELSIRLNISVQSLVVPELTEGVMSAINTGAASVEAAFVPAIHAVVYPNEQLSYSGDLPGEILGPRNIWTLSLRADATINQREFYSAAPLASDAHITFLNRLETALSQD